MENEDLVQIEDNPIDQFNVLYQKYRDGQADEQQRKAVIETVMQARQIANYHLMDDVDEIVQPQVIYRDNTPTFKQKMTRFLKKLKHRVIALLVLAILIAGCLGVGYIKCSSHSRSNDRVGSYNAETMAVEYLQDHGYDVSNMKITSSKKQLVFCWPMERSYYLYQYSFDLSGNRNLTVTVDSFSGVVDLAQYD